MARLRAPPNRCLKLAGARVGRIALPRPAGLGGAGRSLAPARTPPAA